MVFFYKSTRATAGPRWFGIDLAKRESQVSVLDRGGIQIETKRFATTRENFLAMAAELREGDTAALEVTTNSTSIARLIRDNSPARVIVSNPVKTKTIAQAKIKTDKIDARVLAELARVGYLPEVWLPGRGHGSSPSVHHGPSGLRQTADRVQERHPLGAAPQHGASGAKRPVRIDRTTLARGHHSGR